MKVLLFLSLFAVVAHAQPISFDPTTSEAYEVYWFRQGGVDKAMVNRFYAFATDITRVTGNHLIWSRAGTIGVPPTQLQNHGFLSPGNQVWAEAVEEIVDLFNIPTKSFLYGLSVYNGDGTAPVQPVIEHNYIFPDKTDVFVDSASVRIVNNPATGDLQHEITYVVSGKQLLPSWQNTGTMVIDIISGFNGPVVNTLIYDLHGHSRFAVSRTYFETEYALMSTQYYIRATIVSPEGTKVAERECHLLYQSDWNGNGRPDGGDFLEWQARFGLTGPKGDYDLDGDVDGDDYLFWQAEVYWYESQ